MLSAFVNRELGQAELEEIGRHLMQCADCRAEHDRIRLGSTLAATISQADAPRSVWSRINADLDQKNAPRMTLIPDASYFGPRNVASYAVGLIMLVAVASVVYLALLRPAPDQARQDLPMLNPGPAVPQEVPNAPPENPVVGSEQANITLPNTAANTQPATPEIASSAAWEFETISGAPKVGDSSNAERIAVGEVLETDARSRARIAIADIGNVEIAPNSRVRMVGTSEKQHRLSLELGLLHAKIAAPPRLFIVDTPSAVAVDLGCEYTLDVDKSGNSKLSVTSGFVALERDGRESIVPAGVSCLTMKGKGLGTPFATDTTEEFRKALERFDFSGGGRAAVQTILAKRGFYDMISLWHLLSRVSPADRLAVYDALSEYVKPPAKVTRDGVLKLNKSMLDAWRDEVERVWFE